MGSAQFTMTYNKTAVSKKSHGDDGTLKVAILNETCVCTYIDQKRDVKRCDDKNTFRCFRTTSTGDDHSHEQRFQVAESLSFWAQDA